MKILKKKIKIGEMREKVGRIYKITPIEKEVNKINIDKDNMLALLIIVASLIPWIFFLFITLLIIILGV